MYYDEGIALPVRHQGTLLDATDLTSRTQMPDDYREVRSISARDIQCPFCAAEPGEDCTSGLKAAPGRRNGPRAPLLCPERIELARHLAADGKLASQVVLPKEKTGPRAGACGCIMDGYDGSSLTNPQRVKIPCPGHQCQAIKTNGERCALKRVSEKFCVNHTCGIEGCLEKAGLRRRCPAHKGTTAKMTALPARPAGTPWQ
jgi:hypothetical protein